MGPEHGVTTAEVWLAFVHTKIVRKPVHQEPYRQVCFFVEIEQISSCSFSDSRRPMPRLTLPLHKIRHCQDSCSKVFQNGMPLETTVRALREGKTTVAKLGIRVVNLGGVYFALNNRRLHCVKSAFPQSIHPNLEVPVLRVSLSNPDIEKEWTTKFTVGQRIPWHEDFQQGSGTHPGGQTESRKQKRQQQQQQRQQQQQQQQQQQNSRGSDLTNSSGTTANYESSTGGDGALMCAACGLGLPQSSYSTAQLRKKTAAVAENALGLDEEPDGCVWQVYAGLTCDACHVPSRVANPCGSVLVVTSRVEVVFSVAQVELAVCMPHCEEALWSAWRGDVRFVRSSVTFEEECAFCL
eukprot:CAMPEP_0183520784 /NCGR_PEP_ID=MMETSP0371-20130417/17187_1 /TAXON_ID=268820 /ORGANISM="Peridinium aciculiferum, Strain PAER-2" /LENGTH=351 /DNA_ID=CAMNT_0025719211 /DNA_START=89 /DNA_END=1145 /DNA_ORIENTATION=+